METTTLLDNYQRTLARLIERFSKIYFPSAESDIIWNVNIWLWPVEICDYYRDIDKIVTALYNDIQSKILFKRYELHLNAITDNKTCINLYNYWKQNV